MADPLHPQVRVRDAGDEGLSLPVLEVRVDERAWTFVDLGVGVAHHDLTARILSSALRHAEREAVKPYEDIAPKLKANVDRIARERNAARADVRELVGALASALERVHEVYDSDIALRKHVTALLARHREGAEPEDVDDTEDAAARSAAYDALHAEATAHPEDVEAKRGIYRKYRVDRLNDPDGKHTDCEYFVLDWNHDPFAIPAARAYATACEVTHPGLAHDLRNTADNAARVHGIAGPDAKHRDPTDLIATLVSIPRPAGCRCHWEEGDSECPVHPTAGAAAATEDVEARLREMAAEMRSIADPQPLYARLRAAYALGAGRGR